MTRTRTLLIIGGVALVAALVAAAPALADLIAGVPPAPGPHVVLLKSDAAPTAVQLAAVAGAAPAAASTSVAGAPPAPVDPSAPTAGLSVTP